MEYDFRAGVLTLSDKASKGQREDESGTLAAAILEAEGFSVVKQEIAEAWEALDCCYPLTIEPEIFWRQGAPPKRRSVRVSDSR